MRLKTMVELLTLTSNLYLIAKDNGLMEKLQAAVKTENEKTGSGAGTGEEEELLEKVLHRLRAAKEALEEKMEEVAVTVYRKMHIAHAGDLKNALQKIEELEKKIGLLEARLNHINQPR